ncbi:MAG: ATPase domain-containing protein [Nitrososphaera sp.]|jgi:archaellum biogenesis ATPase FlaH
MGQLAKNILGGTTIIEEDVRSVSSIFSKQIASLALSSGKKVAYLTTGLKQDIVDSAKVFRFELDGCVEELRTEMFSLSSHQNLREADLIIIDSFSVYIFSKTEAEIVELITEICRASKEGKSFVLTYEARMLPSTIDAYIKSVVDTIITIKADFVGSKINRLIFVQKIRGGKPYDKLVKFTVENDGIQIDTRELIG